MKKFALITVILGIAWACSQEDLHSPSSSSLDLESLRNSNMHPITTLGRVLFYDKALSANHSVSCGSCHKQEFAFADNQAFSKGLDSRDSKRNTPALHLPQLITLLDPIAENSNHFFWDGRVQNINRASILPIFDHIEMGMPSGEHLVSRLENYPYYRTLFADAFGSEEITTNKIGTALADFISQLNLGNTEFEDLFFSGELDFANPENSRNYKIAKGFLLFNSSYNCQSCHNVLSPTGYDISSTTSAFSNIGLQSNYADKGRGLVTKDLADNGKFRIPNLRNVARSAPYMHDGRFQTLDEVLDHYSYNVVNHPNLDPRIENNRGIRQIISPEDREFLLAFLESLNTPSTFNPSHSNPFK